MAPVYRVEPFESPHRGSDSQWLPFRLDRCRGPETARSE
jgi:hypothetical protein